MLLKPPRATSVSSSFAVACVNVVVLLTGSVCLAQVAGGTISGSVIDSSGSAIAGAQLAVSNSETAIVSFPIYLACAMTGLLATRLE